MTKIWLKLISILVQKTKTKSKMVVKNNTDKQISFFILLFSFYEWVMYFIILFYSPLKLTLNMTLDNRCIYYQKQWKIKCVICKIPTFVWMQVFVKLWRGADLNWDNEEKRVRRSWQINLKIFNFELGSGQEIGLKRSFGAFCWIP